MQTINLILCFENVIWCAAQLPRDVHGRRVRHVMRIASHCVPMDGPCAYNTNSPFPSLYTPCRGSPRHAVFTLTNAVVKFANDYAFFFLSLSEPSLVRQRPSKRYPLVSSERTKIWRVSLPHAKISVPSLPERYIVKEIPLYNIVRLVGETFSRWRKCANQDEFLKSLHRLSSSFAKATRNLLCAFLGIFIFRAAININLFL